MSRLSFVSARAAITQSRIVAIIRLPDYAQAVPIARALTVGGIAARRSAPQEGKQAGDAEERGSGERSGHVRLRKRG